MKLRLICITLCLYVISVAIRLVGLDWDAGQHLHPDERFLTQVTVSLSIPHSLTQFLDPTISPANPHNVGYPYYVYGTFPIFVVKLLAILFHADTYGQLIYVGRIASAVVDSMTGIIIAGIALRMGVGRKVAVLSQAVYAVLPLPIQLSHFYAVDPWLVCSLTLALFSYLKWHRPGWALLSGVATAIAVACKIQAYVFIPLAAIVVVLQLRQLSLTRILVCSLLTCISGFITLRLAQPYLFSSANFFEVRPNPKVIANWQELERLYSPQTYNTDKSGIFFPPAAMFVSTQNFMFMPLNLVTIGVGIPFTILAVIGGGVIVARIRHRRAPLIMGIIMAWMIGVDIYQSTLFSKYMRYLGMLYPYIALLISVALVWFSRRRYAFIGYILAVVSLLLPAGLIYMYTQPHPRVAASEWIYTHLSPETVVTFEHWDDPLPLCLPTFGCPTVQQAELKMFDPDTPAKWSGVIMQLQRADYVMLSSNRVYGSLTWLPDRYPVTTRYYQALFSGELGFQLDQQFTNRPRLPIPAIHTCLRQPDVGYGKIVDPMTTCDEGVSLVDDYVDESFTVYDHPRVLIFKKVFTADYAAILGLSQ